MASGNHTYSGICADLPVAPTSSSKQIAVTIPADCSTGNCCALAKTVGKSSEPNVTTIRNIASEKPKSPTRLTINAFLPASLADFFTK